MPARPTDADTNTAFVGRDEIFAPQCIHNDQPITLKWFASDSLRFAWNIDRIVWLWSIHLVATFDSVLYFLSTPTIEQTNKTQLMRCRTMTRTQNDAPKCSAAKESTMIITTFQTPIDKTARANDQDQNYLRFVCTSLTQLSRHSLPVVKQFRAIKCIYFRLCYSMHRSHWVHRPSSVRMCTPTVVHWTICTVSAARYKFSIAHTYAMLDTAYRTSTTGHRREVK